MPRCPPSDSIGIHGRDLAFEMEEYLRKRSFISALCRLTPEEEQRVLDSLPASALKRNREKVPRPQYEIRSGIYYTVYPGTNDTNGCQ